MSLLIHLVTRTHSQSHLYFFRCCANFFKLSLRRAQIMLIIWFYLVILFCSGFFSVASVWAFFHSTIQFSQIQCEKCVCMSLFIAALSRRWCWERVVYIISHLIRISFWSYTYALPHLLLTFTCAGAVAVCVCVFKREARLINLRVCDYMNAKNLDATVFWWFFFLSSSLHTRQESTRKYARKWLWMSSGKIHFLAATSSKNDRQ